MEKLRSILLLSLFLTTHNTSKYTILYIYCVPEGKGGIFEIVLY
jgi:hypothetical protein